MVIPRQPCGKGENQRGGEKQARGVLRRGDPLELYMRLGTVKRLVCGEGTMCDTYDGFKFPRKYYRAFLEDVLRDSVLCENH